MISDLSKLIDQLKRKSKEKEEKIKDMFLFFSQIRMEQDNIECQHKLPFNFVLMLRIEIVEQILSFLDFKSQLIFRLVDNSANQIFLKTIPKKLKLLQQEQANLQQQLEILEKEKSWNQADEENFIEQGRAGLLGMTKSDIGELKAFPHPPQIIEKVMSYLLVLIEPTFNSSSDIWKQVKKYLTDVQFLQRIQNLDLDEVTEQQIHLIQGIEQINRNQVFNTSKSGVKIFDFVKTVFLTCGSEVFQKGRKARIINHQVFKLKTRIQVLSNIEQ